MNANSMQASTRASKIWPWLIVVGCMGFYAIPTALIGNTAGLFVAPVMDEFGWSQTDTTMYRTIQPLVSAITCPIAAKLLAKHNPRWILTGVTLVFGMASAASAFATTLFAWNMYGVVYGITAGFFMYLATPTLLNSWFRKSYGIAVAITAAALSIIGAVASPIVQDLISTYGWQTARLQLSVFSTVAGGALCVLFVRQSPCAMGLLAYGEEPSGVADDAPNDVVRDERERVDEICIEPEDEAGASVEVARKSPAYYTLILVAVIFVMCAAFFQQIPAYCARGSLGAAAGAMAVSIMMLGGVAFKLLLGVLSDYVGIGKTGVGSALGGALGIAIAYIAGQNGNTTLFYLGMVVFGAGYAGLTVIAPTLARETFGAKNYSELYSWVTTGIFLGTAACFTLFGVIYDATKSYDYCFYLVIALYLVAAALIPYTYKKGRALWWGKR